MGENDVVVSSDENTAVVCVDSPGAGGACHEYEVWSKDSTGERTDLPARISFQNGPIGENGANGCTNEDLIEVVLHRLRGFQSGKFSCRANAIAITHLEDALFRLRDRTADRVRRGVEANRRPEMRRYDPKELCPKCGEHWHRLKYFREIETFKPPEYKESTVTPEHIVVKCSACKFKWERAPLNLWQ